MVDESYGIIPYSEIADLKKQLSQLQENKTNDKDKLFGSVTTQDIHKALLEKELDIDRHMILLEEPIKALGVYDIPIKISDDLQPGIKLYIIKA